MIFTFGPTAEFDAANDRVGFPIELLPYQGMAFVSRRILRQIAGRPVPPEHAVDVFEEMRLPCERAVERRITARLLDPDGNVHLSARDIRQAAAD